MEDFRRRIPAERSSAASDVVPHSPQSLVLSSTSTTSLGPKAPAACRTWCFTPRKTLFFRFPCTKFLALFGASTPWTWCKDSRKTLFLRFSCTKSPAQDEPPPLFTWCSIPRNPLFLRRGASRPRPRMGLEKEVRTNLPFDCTSFHFYSV